MAATKVLCSLYKSIASDVFIENPSECRDSLCYLWTIRAANDNLKGLAAIGSLPSIMIKLTEEESRRTGLNLLRDRMTCHATERLQVTLRNNTESENLLPVLSIDF